MSQCKIAEQVLDLKEKNGLSGTLTIQPALSDSPNMSPEKSTNQETKKKFIRRTNTTIAQVDHEPMPGMDSKKTHSALSVQPILQTNEVSSIDIAEQSRDRTNSNLTNQMEQHPFEHLQAVSFLKLRHSDPIQSSPAIRELVQPNSPTKRSDPEPGKYKFGSTEAMQELKRQSTLGGDSPDRSKASPLQQRTEDLLYEPGTGGTGSYSGSPQPTVHKGVSEIGESGVSGKTGGLTYPKEKNMPHKQSAIIVVERAGGFHNQRDGSPAMQTENDPTDDYAELVKFKPIMKDAKCILKSDTSFRSPPKGSEILAFKIPKSKRINPTPPSSRNYFVGPTHHSFTGLRTKEPFSQSSGYIHSPTHRVSKLSDGRSSIYGQDFQSKLGSAGFGQQRGSSPELHSANRDRNVDLRNKDLATRELEAMEDLHGSGIISRGRQDRRISILSAGTNPSFFKGPTDSISTIKPKWKAPTLSNIPGSAWDSHGRLASEEINRNSPRASKPSVVHKPGCAGAQGHRGKGETSMQKPFFCDCSSNPTLRTTTKARYLILSPKKSPTKNAIENFRYPITEDSNIDETSVHHPDYFGLLKF